MFPIEQIEGIEWKFPVLDPDAELKPIVQCEKLVSEMIFSPTIVHKGTLAFYRTDLDLINVQQKHLFKNIEFYYSLFFHELVIYADIGIRYIQQDIVKDSPEKELREAIILIRKPTVKKN